MVVVVRSVGRMVGRQGLIHGFWGVVRKRWAGKHWESLAATLATLASQATQATQATLVHWVQHQRVQHLRRQEVLVGAGMDPNGRTLGTGTSTRLANTR